jgi:hypothetical protein
MMNLLSPENLGESCRVGESALETLDVNLAKQPLHRRVSLRLLSNATQRCYRMSGFIYGS